MKKILILILMLFLSGCSIDSTKSNQEYNDYLTILKRTDSCASTYDYHIEVVLERLTTKEYVYQVVIDEPKELLEDIKVLVSHDAVTDDVFPSLGFFDGTYNLDKIKTDTATRGINLVGYIPIDYNLSSPITIKVYVIYGKEDIKSSCHIFSLDRK